MSPFAATRWSLVAELNKDEASAEAALQELCRIYRPAVLAYATVAVHGDRHTAEDLTQEFFSDIISKRRLQEARQQQGKFRTFLLTHFQFTLKDFFKKGHALKRGGNAVHLSTQSLSDSDHPSVMPDCSIFDREWALALIREALNELAREEASKKDQGVPFDELKAYLPGIQQQKKAYSELAQEFATSEGAIRVRVNRLRQRFKNIIDAQLADTVIGADQFADEREALLCAIPY